MKTERFKKSLSILLAVIVMFTMMPAIGLVSEVGASYPTMKAYLSLPVNNLPDYHVYRDRIVTATFLDEIDTEGAVMQWDISEDEGSGAVMAWIKINAEETQAAGADMYDLYIAGDGGVGANAKASNVFYTFTKLKQVNGLENFNTSNATTLDSFFEKCSSLKSVDLSSFDTSNVTNFNWLFMDCVQLETVNLANWDTSNVTTMFRMFMNCENLKTLDVSSFDTRKVTNMERMFYRCMALENIYIGDYWTVEKVTSDNAMFNCCYAIVGGKEIYDRDFQYIPPRKEYAKLREEGGFLDRKPEVKEYKVTYEYIGDIIPEGVTAPTAASYEEGTTVTVAENACAEGYIFSGWSTEDEDITSGSFEIYNDVHIVGSWTKLYQVIYKYDEGYEVPAYAPQIPDVELWFAPGEDVPTYGIPYADGYVFVGWNTEDADVAGDSFIMPENDVVFYGYYKKPVESVEVIGDKDIILDVNDTDGEKINVYVKPEDATIKEIVYETSDDKVAIVENGVIKPVGEGTATVTVASKDDPTKSDTITVTVKTLVKDIEVDKTEIILNKGNTDKITATVTPDDATNKGVTYESGDDKVVTVDKDGNIVAVGEGTTTITVTSDDNPDVKKEITVTVKIPVTEITSKEELILNLNTEDNVDAKVNEDATNKELIYETGDPGIAKVDSEGNVIGVGEGTTTITVTSKDNPEIKREITVTVKVPVKDITVDKTDITLEEGKTDKITVTVTPDNATEKGVTYESSNEEIVKVDENGNIEAVGEGEATITITSKDDPTVTEKVTVTVKKPKVPVKDITVDKTDITLEEGKTDKITVTVTPDNATEKGVTYESSNEEIVRVDENGNIEAVDEGEATITITSKDDPTVTEKVTVTVKKKQEPDNPDVPDIPEEPEEPEYVIEVPSEIEIVPGITELLNIRITPDDGKVKPVFSSADESIATVDEFGNVTGVAAGETTIYVDFGNGDIRAVAVIVVAPAIPSIPRKHHVCFGKTDGIGWYEVSVNGGDFFPQGPNSTLEVDHGSILVVRVQDMWIDDEFDFYVNGNKVPLDPANTITVYVDGYKLIGALSMDVEVPDVNESLTLLQKIVNAIKDFFAWIASWFK